MKSSNNAINSDAKKLRYAPLFVSGYGWRYAFQYHTIEGYIMRESIFIFTGLLLMFVVSASANADTKLYKEYKFGMQKAEIMKEFNVYDCSEEFENGALCLNEQKFAGEDIEIGFRFLNNKLVTVILFSEFTEDNYINFIGALSSKFQLITIESADKKIDFIVQMKKFKKAEFLKNITDFEQQALASGNIKYTFIEKDSFEKLVRSSVNAVEMIMKSDNSTRAIEYIIAEVDENTVAGLIQFSAPKKSLQLIQEKSKQKYDDF
jgi:hypothetical protein